MEELRADFRNATETLTRELGRLRSTAKLLFERLHTQQDARLSRRGTSQRTAGRSHPVGPTREDLEENFISACSQIEMNVQQFTQHFEERLASTNPFFNTDTSARGRSSGADSRPTDDAALINSSPIDSANNTSPNAPPADDAARLPSAGSSPGNGSSADAAYLSPNGSSLGNDSSADTARSSPNGSPPNHSPTDADPPLIGSRRPLLSSRPARGPSALCADSPSADGPNAPPCTGFTLEPFNLGECLIPKLQTFIENDKFKGKLRLRGMKLWLREMGLSSTAFLEAIPSLKSTEQGVVRGVVHKSGKDNTWCLQIADPLDRLQPPRLSDVAYPSGEDAERFLEKLSKKPPNNPIPYYVGPLAGPFAKKLQSDFPSGKEVCQLGDIPSVSTLYRHIGGKGSGTTFHCEDANLRSYNLALIG